MLRRRIRYISLFPPPPAGRKVRKRCRGARDGAYACGMPPRGARVQARVLSVGISRLRSAKAGAGMRERSAGSVPHGRKKKRKVCAEKRERVRARRAQRFVPMPVAAQNARGAWRVRVRCAVRPCRSCGRKTVFDGGDAAQRVLRECVSPLCPRRVKWGSRRCLCA